MPSIDEEEEKDEIANKEEVNLTEEIANKVEKFEEVDVVDSVEFMSLVEKKMKQKGKHYCGWMSFSLLRALIPFTATTLTMKTETLNLPKS